MPLSFNVNGADKDGLVTSLAALVLNDSKADITAESINAVLAASGILFDTLHILLCFFFH